MQEMVEPDRTIMIVSIIGLVVIWGSVAYHKFIQGGGPPQVEDELPSELSASTAEAAGSGEEQQKTAASQQGRRGGKGGKKR